jgi:hypothetical protein
VRQHQDCRHPTSQRRAHAASPVPQRDVIGLISYVSRIARQSMTATTRPPPPPGRSQMSRQRPVRSARPNL